MHDLIVHQTNKHTVPVTYAMHDLMLVTALEAFQYHLQDAFRF